jgi:Cellulase (glycosyl hydrolase family 5)
MTKRKPIKYYRIFFGIITIVTTSILIGVFSKVIVYFNSGADRKTALNVPPNLPDTHVPSIKWLPDDAETGRKMEDFSRNEIIKDYIRGWYQQHLSYASNESIGLKEYFTPSALPKVVNNIKKLKTDGFQLYQTDLQHNINLHFYSADGQIVSFTDKQLVMKQRLYKKNTKEKFFTDETTNDYDVVMLLDDGYWRVKNCVRKAPSEIQVETEPSNKEPMVQVSGKQFFLKGVPFMPKGINYYPQKTPWTFFWTKYESKIIKKDFALTRSLGFNTVRIFINFHDFNKGNVPIERLEQLQNLLDHAEKAGLKVVITLFDFMGDYSLFNFTASDRQLESLLYRFRNHPAIFAWDLKNEPDLDYKYHDVEDVKEWLTWTLKRARIYDPNHLFTVGWAYPQNVDFLSEELDFVSFHSYKALDVLSGEIDVMQSKIKNKPLVLEEFGLSTYRGIWAPYGKTEQEQADYFSSVRAILKKKGNIPYLAWTLYDFSEVPSGVVGKLPWRKNPQKNFGIISQDGKIKPSAKVLGGE